MVKDAWFVGSITLTHTAHRRSPIELERDEWGLVVLVNSGRLTQSEWKLSLEVFKSDLKTREDMGELDFRGRGRMMWNISGTAINLKECVINCIFFKKAHCIFLLFTESSLTGASQCLMPRY